MNKDTDGDVGVESGQHIVEDHPVTPFHLSLHEADGRGFEDVKGTKEAKTGKEIGPGRGQGNHDRQKTHYFINNDAPVVLLLKDNLRPSGGPAGQQSEA